MLRLALAALLGLLAAAGCATSRPSGGGTAAPYTVDGQTYTPLREWDGYAQEGLASWYGPSYHGRPTASGERFDTNALTGAHTVLPMHVCVHVESLETGQTVTVRINDRGPFVPGRIIDLSRAAAAAIGLIRPGVARVRLEARALADRRGHCPGPSAILPPEPAPRVSPPAESPAHEPAAWRTTASD